MNGGNIMKSDDIKTVNFFMEPIYAKKKFSILSWLKMKFFIHKLNKISPDFNMLWEIADFCKILEVVYMYDNSNNSKLYSSTKQTNGMNSFIIKNESCSILYTLDASAKEICIEIKRNIGNKSNSIIRFIDGEAEIKTEDNKHLFINLINWLMDDVVELIERYYKIYKV